MTVINPNSISGIASVTAQGDIIQFYKSDGTLGAVQFDGANFNTTSGVSTFKNLYVGGVLTYEDVKNVDSVGIITAREGIKIPDDKYIKIGSSDDLQIYHAAGAATHINTTGLINIDGTTGVRLEYNNANRVYCTSTGVTLGGDIEIADKIVHEGDTNTAIRFPDPNTFTVETAANERLRIDADGRLLQNITAVGDYMHQMQGAGGTGKVPAILFKNGTASVNEIIGGWTAYNTTNQVASIYAKEQSANDDAYLQFSTRKTGGSLTERFKIFSDGRSRFTGQDNGNTLEVFAGTTTGQSQGILIDAGTNSSDYAVHIRKVDNTDIMKITGDGKVGLGIAAPLHNLHIKPPTASETVLKIESESGYDARLKLDTSSGGGAEARIDFEEDASIRGFISYTNNSGGTTDDMVFGTATYERLRINSSGQLIMTNAATQTFFDFSTTNNSTRGLFSIAGKDSSGNAVTVRIGGFGDTNRGEIFTHSNHGLGFATNNAATQMVLTTGGNLGVGLVTGVDTRLTVKAASGTDVVGKFVSTDAKAWIQFRDNSTTDTGVMIGAEGDDLMLRAGSNERLRINSTGGVGIGTDNFASDLDNRPGLAIHSNHNDSCRLLITTPTKSPTRLGYYGLNRFGIDVQYGFQIRDVADSYATRLLIDNNGKVFIGSTSDHGPSAYNLANRGLSITAEGENVLRVLDSTSYAANVGGAILIGGNYRTTGDTQPFVELKSFKENGTDTDYAYGFRIGTTKNGGSIIERLRISSGGGHSIWNDTAYYAGNLTECNTDHLPLNIRKTRNGHTKGIAFGPIGSASFTTIQGYDTSDNSANNLTLNPLGGQVVINTSSPVSGNNYATVHVGGDASSSGGGNVLIGNIYNSGLKNPKNCQLILAGQHNSTGYNGDGQVKLYITGSDNDGSVVNYPIFCEDENANVQMAARQNGTEFGVGIGSATPAANLDVCGSAPEIRLTNTATNNAYLSWYNHYGAVNKNADISYNEGNANWQFKLYRADGQADSPYGNIQFYTGSTSSPTLAMNITRPGSVTMPKQPCCVMYASSSVTWTSGWVKIPINNTRYDIGNNFDASNNRYQIPVTGKYAIGYNVELNISSGQTWIYFVPRINRNDTTSTNAGINYADFAPVSNNSSNHYYSKQGHWIAHLGQGDTVTFEMHGAGNAWTVNNNNQSHYYIYQVA